MEEIIVEIDETGAPVVSVKGVKGKGCQDMTKALEEALGGVKQSHRTGEYHQRPAVKQARKAQH